MLCQRQSLIFLFMSSFLISCSNRPSDQLIKSCIKSTSRISIPDNELVISNFEIVRKEEKKDTTLGQNLQYEIYEVDFDVKALTNLFCQKGTKFVLDCANEARSKSIPQLTTRLPIKLESGATLDKLKGAAVFIMDKNKKPSEWKCYKNPLDGIFH